MDECKDVELIDSFVAESQDMLDEVETVFIELRGIPIGSVNPDTVNAVFRLYHSMKGSAAFLGLNNIAAITHKAETLLNLVRDGHGIPDESFVDVQLVTLDAIREILAHIQTEKTDDGFEATRESVVTQLDAAIAKMTGTVRNSDEDHYVPSRAPANPTETKASASAEEIPPPSGPILEESTGQDDLDEIPELVITDEMKARFCRDAGDILDEVEQTLLALEKADETEKAKLVNDAFRGIHSFKGNCGFMQLADLEKLSHKTETVLGSMRDSKLPLDEGNIEILLQVVDSLKEGINSVSFDGNGMVPNCRVMIEFLDEMMPISTPEKKMVKAPSGPVETNVAVTRTTVTREANRQVTEKSPVKPFPIDTKPKSAGGQQPQARRDIRVDVDKLDTLINLVGELIIAEAMVLRNPALLNVEDESLDRAIHLLRRVSTDLQDIAMSVRMVPLSSTFRRMLRLVHDLSMKSGKRAVIELRGEDTEVDKNVIEHIGDPLVHIIRNSMDHGIELPETRRAAGKDEIGKIILEARHVGGEVWIVIHDDGKGLDRKKIVEKAVERGLVRGNPEELGDEEIFGMIFRPGFSTAEKITDISGRGVGMDVVKKNLEKVNGKVRVTSAPGKGTDITLQIPLTLAIIEGLLVRVGKSQYTIPLLSIRESIPHPPKEWITSTPDGNESVLIRNELIPILRLHEIFNKHDAETDLSKGILVIVQHESDCIAILVDELLGQQETVIKGLSSYLSRAKGISGCTVLGNGEVSLILDVGGLIKAQTGENGVLGR